MCDCVLHFIKQQTKGVKMKLSIILLLFSLSANASQLECLEGIKSFNKKYKPEAEFVFADFTERSILFMRHKIGAKGSQSQTAEAMGFVRTCIKAGFTNTIYMGDIGNDTPKTICQVQNLNTMGAVCDKLVNGGRAVKYKIIEVK